MKNKKKGKKDLIGTNNSDYIGPDADLAFWRALTEFVHRHPLVIDRPSGSSHPRFPDLVYPLDYGYLEGTTAMDGNGIDVWRGKTGGADIAGIFCSLDLTKNDAEIKIAIGCDEEDILSIKKVYDTENWKAIFIVNPLAP